MTSIALNKVFTSWCCWRLSQGTPVQYCMPIHLTDVEIVQWITENTDLLPFRAPPKCVKRKPPDTVEVRTRFLWNPSDSYIEIFHKKYRMVKNHGGTTWKVGGLSVWADFLFGDCVCNKWLGNPSHSCWDISVLTKLVGTTDWQTNIAIAVSSISKVSPLTDTQRCFCDAWYDSCQLVPKQRHIGLPG